ncbi:MAG: MarR family transcriptional regulator, partial [Burkholderiales bacterium]|nr:MarR family transcriptional regulator [Burkholderiales bacterium]
MSRKLYLGISTREDALDRFEAAWHLASGRKAPEPLALLSFADLPLLLRMLTPARWQLLRRLAKAGPLSVYALARLLGRDYKNVHTDVAQLVSLNLIEKTEENLVRVAWEAIRAEFR